MNPIPELRQPRSPGKSKATIPIRLSTFIREISAIAVADKRALAWRVTREKGELLRYYQVRYVRSALTDYRAAVREALGPDHPAVAYLRLSVDDQADVNQLDRAQVRLRHTSLRPIDPDRLIDAALEMLGTGKHAYLSAALSLLTGRRPVEIYCTGILRPSNDERVPNPLDLEEDDSVIFEGQAKTRGAASGRHSPFRIPTLTYGLDICEAFVRLRQAKSFDLPEAVNPSVAKPQAEAASRSGLVDENNERLQIKELRAAYATIAYIYFCPPNVTIGAFFREILGHGEDETSTLSYFKFYVVGHLGDTLAAIERSKSDELAALMRIANEQDDEKRRALIDDRIVALQSVMETSSIVRAKQTHNERIEEADAARVRMVRELIEGLSPAQATLLRDVANGVTTPASRDRRTIRLLEERGLLELHVGEGNLATIALTELGQEVRDQLPPETQAPRTEKGP